MAPAIGAAIIGAAGNIASGAMNYGLSQEMSDHDRRQNYLYGEMSAENAYQRQRQLYMDYYSPEALLKQYKSAGLSPSLMFGGTPGQGGTSAPQGNGASGPQSTYAPVSLIEGAQAAALMAQARKTNAETDTIEGKNKRGEAELKQLQEQTNNIIANTENTELKSVNEKIQSQILNLDAQIKAATKDDVIKTVKANLMLIDENLTKVKNEIHQLKLQNQITEEAAESIIESYRNQITLQLAEASLKYAQADLARANIRLTSTQVQKLWNDMQIDWANIAIGQEGNRINERKIEEITKQWAFENGLKGEQNVREWINLVTNFLTGIIGKTGQATHSAASAVMAGQ